MSVARGQIDEVYRAVCRYVAPNRVAALLEALAATEAYERNRSFRETVDLLRERHRGDG